MNSKKTILILLPGLLALPLLGGGTFLLANGSPAASEIEPFSDVTLGENIRLMREGFALSGTIVQERYPAAYDAEGFPVISGEPQETNTYYNEIAFNGAEEAMSRYSYRVEGGVTIDAEGPYAYFSDENGRAYQESLNERNEVVQEFADLTFGDNGFYNFATILLEEDLVLDEDFEAYVRYDVDPGKAGVIANNLLYSLNSGAFSLPQEAYFRVDGGKFTSFSLVLSPITSIDSLTGAASLISNRATFYIESLGERTIEHLSPLEEDADAKRVGDAFSTLEGQSFTMRVEDKRTEQNLADKTSADVEETMEYSFTGRELYVHDVTKTGLPGPVFEDDYYLAPRSEMDPSLYPYAYDSESGEWVIHEEGIYEEDGSSPFASGYCGAYVYEDLLPTIAGVSGAFFEKVGEEYVSKEGYASLLTDCFHIDRRPFAIDGMDGLEEVRVTLGEDGGIEKIVLSYGLLDGIMGTYVSGEATITFSGVGSTTLEGLIG